MTQIKRFRSIRIVPTDRPYADHPSVYEIVSGPSSEGPRERSDIIKVGFGKQRLSGTIDFYPKNGGLHYCIFGQESQLISKDQATIIFFQDDASFGGETVQVGTTTPLEDGSFQMEFNAPFGAEYSRYRDFQNCTWEEYLHAHPVRLPSWFQRLKDQVRWRVSSWMEDMSSRFSFNS